MHSFKTETKWLSTRKKLLRDIQKRVSQHLGHLSPEVQAYQEIYEKEFSKKWRASTKVELIGHLLKSDLAYSSDFHAFNQSQRLHLRLLRSLQGRRNVVLAVEFLESQHQEELELFLEEKISEKEFLKRVDWHRRWGFNWLHYRPLLEYARKNGISVYGINRHFKTRSGKSLKQRDQHAARKIVEIKKQSSESLVIVIFGDFHLSREHLPREVESRLKKECQSVTIHQNSEKIYFQLASLGLENRVDLVKLRDDAYCVLGAPPWVKWQSYLLHLERVYDQEMDERSDDTDQMVSLCRWIMQDIDCDVDLNTLSVYGRGEEEAFEALCSSLSSKEVDIARELVSMGKTFFLAKTGLGYLSQHTVNHGATLAGYYIHAQLSKMDQMYWDVPNDLRKMVWMETMAYFCSKLVNHRRKTETLEDIRTSLRIDSESEEEKEVFALALDYRMSDLYLLDGKMREKSFFTPRHQMSYWQTAKLLGGMSGEALYEGYRAGMISRPRIQEILSYSLEDPRFESFYLQVLKDLEEVPLSFMSKKERL